MCSACVQYINMTLYKQIIIIQCKCTSSIPTFQGEQNGVNFSFVAPSTLGHFGVKSGQRMSAISVKRLIRPESENFVSPKKLIMPGNSTSQGEQIGANFSFVALSISSKKWTKNELDFGQTPYYSPWFLARI